MECHTTLERVVAQRAKEKFIKDSDFNPCVVNNERFCGYCNWCWRIEHKEAQCWFKQEYMKSNPSQDPLQRDIREWSNTSEKGQGHSQPKGKSEGQGKGKRKHPRKENHNQDQAGSPNEDGQRTLGDFGVKRQRVEFVGDVQENDDFETPRLDRASCVFCVQKCKSVVMDSTELPSSSTRVFDGSEEPAGTHKKLINQRERYFSPLDVEMIDQLLTLEVLCPRAQWIMRRQFRQRKCISV